MRLLLIPLAGGVGLGPLTRCLAIAYEARRRGHQVAFLCKSAFARRIRSFGYTTYRAPQPHDYRVEPPPFRLSDIAVKYGWLNEKYLKSAVKTERRVIRHFKPDLIFTETQFSVPISAALEKIPWAASASWADHPRFRSQLYRRKDTAGGIVLSFNKLLSYYGLTTINDINELAFMHADLKIAPTIPELQPELTNVPGVNFVGYLLSPEMENGPLPNSPRRRANRPFIYVYMSPGDIPPEQWIPTIIKAFKDTPFDVFVTLAPLNIKADRLPHPSNIQFFQSLPATSVIQLARLVITHGGNNTVINALLHGKPLLIYSDRYAERDYNGRAVARFGAGINYRTRYFTPQAVRRSARKIVDNSSYAHNAQGLGKKILSYGGAHRALDLMEQLISRPRKTHFPLLASFRPVLMIFLYGRPGSGKTAVGKKLARRLRCRYIECDDLYTNYEKRQIIQGIITDAMSDRFMERVMAYLEKLLWREGLIVASQSLFRESQRRELKQRFGFRVRLVCLEIPWTLSLKRVIKRDMISYKTTSKHFYTAECYNREAHLFESPITYDIKIDSQRSIHEILDNLVNNLP